MLSISGDFNPDQALQEVEKYFGSIPARQTPAYVPPPAPEQSEERTEVMFDPNATLPAFHLAYHIPPDRTPDHYALELLAIILGDGESSRLYQKLIKQEEICQDIAVGTDDRRGPDLLSVWAVMASGHTNEQAQKLIFSELDSIAADGVTARELEKAKNRVRATFVFGLQSNMLRSQRLAEFELFWGDANLLKLELDHYLRVTAEDIKRVAGTYFNPANRTVLDVLPGTAPAAPKEN